MSPRITVSVEDHATLAYLARRRNRLPADELHAAVRAHHKQWKAQEARRKRRMSR
jgi:hypothetical protein